MHSPLRKGGHWRPYSSGFMVLSCVRVIEQCFSDTAALRVFWSVVVLDLSAVELTFFSVASMGLCFEYRADNIEMFLLRSRRAKPCSAFTLLCC